MSTANQIVLTCAGGRHDEGKAAGAIKPGHLLQKDSNGELVVHATRGGAGPVLVAKEHYLEGQSGLGDVDLFDAYADNDWVPYHRAAPGDLIQVRLPAGAVAVVKADKLISNGDGTVIKYAPSATNTLFAAPAASTALNTHTTITAFDVSYSFPANTVVAGAVYHVRATVLFANASNSTETVLITLKLGSLTIKATAALDNAAADVAVIDCFLHFRAVGASGSVVASGTHAIGPPASAVTLPFYTAAQTIDTTAAMALTVNQTCSGSHANTGGQLVDLTVENVNANGEVLLEADEAVDNSGEETDAMLDVLVV